MAITLTGLASGLDTEAVIAQLMAIEQNKVTAVQRRQISVTQHKTDLNTIKTKLDAVKSAAADLAAAATWKPTQATSSSDPAKVDVTVLSGAGIGGHSIQVDKLAASAQHGFVYTPGAAGQLKFGATSIDIAANATASEVAAAVNSSQAAPVYAAVINDGGSERIVFSARTTGASSDFTVDTSAFGGSLVEDPTYARTGAAALNASYRIDGEAVARSSESNIIESAIPGVRVTLKGVTTSPVSVVTTEPQVDTDGLVKKITALVDAYNAVVTTTRGELTEKRVPTATTSADLQKGQLFGDTSLNAMLASLKNVFTQTGVGLQLDGLAAIGISVPKSTGGASTQDARDGKLVIDTDKLKAALADSPAKVQELFAGSGTTKGMSALISDYVSTQTSGTDGTLTQRMKTDDATLKTFNDQIDRLNARMASEQARLKAQFTAMETALNNAQTQQAWLTSQIASLPMLG